MTRSAAPAPGRRLHASGLPRCGRCGAAVLVTPAGDLLEPEPHALAIHRPDGGRLTWREAADAATGRTAPLGHHRHTDAPGYACQVTAQQLPLPLALTA